MSKTPMEHELKTWPEYYQDVIDGKKTFEVRENHRDYKVGDILRLREFDPMVPDYTGRLSEYKVTYVLSGGAFGIDKGTVVMAIVPLSNESRLIAEHKLMKEAIEFIAKNNPTSACRMCKQTLKKLEDGK